MKKRLFFLVLLFALLIFGYFKLFYKTYSNTNVPFNADAVACVDVKRITNTLIWDFITHTSQWKISGSSSTKDTTVAILDALELPDYIFAFHCNNQPNNIWHTILPIKNKENLFRFLAQNNFTTTNATEFINEPNNIAAIINDNNIILSSSTNKDFAKEVEQNLFVQKKYVDKAILQKIINAKSHAAVLLSKNDLFKDDVIVKANFDYDNLNINASLNFVTDIKFTETDFLVDTASLLSLSIAHQQNNIFDLIDSATKSKISTALNFKIDSVLNKNNKSYELQIVDIVNRQDSAITYTYDDEFNKVEKVVVNNVQEPILNFIVTTKEPASIFNYFVTNKNIEAKNGVNNFISIPFVKATCTTKDSILQIQSVNYISSSTQKEKINAIVFSKIYVEKIKPTLFNYLPDDAKKLLENISTIIIKANNQNGNLNINGTFQKKKNNSPLFKL